MEDKRVIEVDNRNSDQIIEDLAFEIRVRVLTEKRKWRELEANFLLYGSALEERYGG